MDDADLLRRLSSLEAEVARLAGLIAHPATPADDLLTIKQAAAEFGRSDATVRRWARGPSGERIGGRLYVRRSAIARNA